MKISELIEWQKEIISGYQEQGLCFKESYKKLVDDMENNNITWICPDIKKQLEAAE